MRPCFCSPGYAEYDSEGWLYTTGQRELGGGRGNGCWSVSVKERQNRAGRIGVGMEGCKHYRSSVEGRELALLLGVWPG